MAKESPLLNSYNAGELSPLLNARSDLAKYKSGCASMLNMIPAVQGAARKRTGTRFVGIPKFGASGPVRLVPFVFNQDQAYILEFGDRYMQIYKDGGLVLLSDLSGNPAYTATPYSASELADADFKVTGDALYIAHPDHPPAKITRYEHDQWGHSEVEFSWPPFTDLNTSATTVATTGTAGTGLTLTASSGVFKSTDVGSTLKVEVVIVSNYDTWIPDDTVVLGQWIAYNGNVYKATSAGTTGTRPPIHVEGDRSDGGVDWLYVHDGEGYATITGFTSDTVVTIDIEKDLPFTVLTGTDRWAMGAWSETNGFPRTLAFYEDRLWFANTALQPQTLWASASGDYESHKAGTDDDDALNYTINDTEANEIRWLSPGKVLSVGTAGGEFTVRAGSLERPVTPTEVRVFPETLHGSSKVPPIRMGSVTLFAQPSGRRVREYVYSFEVDSFVAVDLTRLASHILPSSVVASSIQNEPDQLVWWALADGSLRGLTYERSDDVVGWHPHLIGGQTAASPGRVESLATIPHWDGDQDVTWMVVERDDVDQPGFTIKTIEYFEKVLEGDAAFHVDGGLTYTGPPATTFGPLPAHLADVEVSIVADGAVVPNLVAVAGMFTLDTPASTVVVGLPMPTPKLQTMPIEAGAQDGTAQGKTKRIDQLVLRVKDTGPGVWYGSADGMDEWNLRDATDAMDESVPLFTGDSEILAFPDGYNHFGQITVEHRLPLPFTLLALMPQLETYDR